MTTTTKLKPIGTRVLVKRLDMKETMKGGILLPDTAKKKEETAEVVAIGTGAIDKNGSPIPSPVKVGEKVLIDKYAGQEVKIDDAEYIIVRFDDIIATVV